jgi:hypothetical protein
MRPLRPYLFGGGASGALLIGMLAAFLSVTALVSRSSLPVSVPTVQQAPHAVTISPAAREAPASRGGGIRIASVAGAPPLSLAVPTASVTTAFPAGTQNGGGPAARRISANRSGAAAHHGAGPTDRLGGARQSPGPGGNGNGGGAGGAGPGGGSGGSSPPASEPPVAKSPAKAPPGLAKKPGGLPPGQAKKAPVSKAPAASPGNSGHATTPPGLVKKPGGLPPGLAKKPGGLPPGQAKKH